MERWDKTVLKNIRRNAKCNQLTKSIIIRLLDSGDRYKNLPHVSSRLHAMSIL